VGDDTAVTIVRVPRIKIDSEQKVPSAVFAMSSHINQDHEAPSSGRWTDNEEGRKELAEVDFRGVSPSEHHVATETLARKLSARQVQMIAIGGTYSITLP
jgi:amino acid permease